MFDANVTNGIVFENSQVFSTPGSNNFVVPVGTLRIDGQTTVRAKIWGGAGGGGESDASFAGGAGGAGSYMEILIDCTEGETLTIITAQGGNKAVTTTAGAVTTLGYGGAGNGGADPAGGGGADWSGVLRAGTPLAIAAGGGGGGGGATLAGSTGGGGDCAGKFGADYLVQPGNQVAPGGVGLSSVGASLTGGTGDNRGGGGGGGYFGGAGGKSSTSIGCGGAGGSSYHAQSGTVIEKFIPGTATPNTGDSDYIAGVAVGGTGATAGSNNATDGGAGLVVIYY